MLTEKVSVAEYEYPNLVPTTPTDSVEPVKCCSKCKKTKPLTHFALRTSRPDGRQPYCRECKKIYSAKRHSSLYSSPAYRAKRLVSFARRRHRLSEWQVPFDLTDAWAERILRAGHCQATGIKFVLDGSDDDTSRHRYTPTIDRIDSSRGYTKDNCQIVIWQHNAAKGEGSQQDVLIYAETLLRKQRPDLFIHERPANGLLN